MSPTSEAGPDDAATAPRPVSATSTALAVGGVIALVALGVLVGSVWDRGGDDSANGSVPVDDIGALAGPAWVVVNDGSAPAPVQGTVRLEFPPGGRVSAETGCNGVRGPASVEDSVLVTGPLMSTRMACEPALMEQERWVTEMLDSRPRLELSGPYLALHWGEGEQWWLGLEREGWRDGTNPTLPAS
jgi:heat shock protein HslJ